MRHLLKSGNERALLVQAIIGAAPREDACESLFELERLAETAGARVFGSITQRRPRPDPAFFIGHGKLSEIQLAARNARANMLIFDNELSAVQVSNLSRSMGLKVIDRTELILQIFARRAKTAESQLQVELAQLQHLASRIPASAKQARFSGGIGMRGPGESPFSLHRAPILKRIEFLKKKLKKIQERRALTRKRRPWKSVCIVGYTNAGKSTLLNALTRAKAYADDRLFATLDTKSRMLRLNNGLEAILTDTVGFIRNLPHSLVASFRSTLEEIRGADLIIIVTDALHARARDHVLVVRETLAEINAGSIESVLVFNKSDLPESAHRLPALLKEHPDALAASALGGQGIEKLKNQIEKLLGP